MTDINEQIKDLEEQIRQHEAAVDNETTETSNPETLSVEDQIAARVAEELKGIKAKLDDAYSARDEAVKAKVQLEEEKRKAEISKLEQEGKHKEVSELKIAELTAKLDSLQKENTTLSRDYAVTEALRPLEFRSDIAADMARDRILGQLVKDEVGRWVHSSGMPVQEYVNNFAKDESNSFLFKARTNSGAGTQTFAAATDNTQSSKPITEMSSEELIQHFAANPGKSLGF